jgi:hypothetical protein
VRKYNPLPADHPLVGKPCPVCGEMFAVGDELTLVPTWPLNKEEARNAQVGRAYTREAKAVHWDCRGRE